MSLFEFRRAQRRRRVGRLSSALLLAGLGVLLLTAGAAVRAKPASAAGPFSTVSPFQPALTPARLWGGRTVAIDVDPGDPNTAIAASESGGLFKTTDDGATWSHVDSLIPFRMADVKYAPGDRRIVIATASSDSGRKVNGSGIFRSTDGGATWSKPATANPACNARASAWGIAFEPGTQNVYVGTDCGVAVSNDRGASWTHVALAQTLGVAAAGGIVHTCSADGYHQSTNSGGAFGAAQPITPGGGGSTNCPGIGVHAIAVSPFEPGVVLSISREPSSPAPNPCNATAAVSLWRLLESDNAGANWTQIGRMCPSRPPSVSVNESTNGVANNWDVYFAGGLNTVRGTCTGFGGPGTRCTPASLGPANNVNVQHADPSMVAFTTSTTSNCAVYLPDDSGVEKSTDCGANFATTGGGPGGYNALQIYEVTGQVHPAGTDLYFGTQDNDIWASSDNGATWPNVQCCEGFFFQIPHNSASSVGQVVTGVVCGPCYTFGGAPPGGNPLFTSIPAWRHPLPTVPPLCTFNCTSNPNGNPFLVETGVYVEFSQPNLSAVTPNANFALYTTTDTGANWTKVTLTSPGSPGIITSGELNVAFSGRPYVSGPPGDPTIFQGYVRPVAGNPIGLLRITGARTATATVTDISTGISSIDTYCNGQGTFVCPTVFGVDPNDPNHIIVADGGANNIKQSTNGGNSYTVDNQLTSLVTDNGAFDFGGQTHVIAWDQSNGSPILVGTEANGVQGSFDNGQSWAHMIGSEEIPAVTSFFFDEVQDDIIISSYGRGLWKIALPGSDLSITKTHRPDPATAGEELYYDLTVTNNGPSAASGVTVRDDLPPEVTFATSTDTCSANSPPPGTGQTVMCSIGDLAPGESRSFTIKVSVNTDAIASTGPKAITNTATVLTAGISDPDLSNNTATDVVIVEDLADLEVTKLCKPDTSPEAGQPIDCTIYVDNHGPSDARDVVLTDTILGSRPFTVSNIVASQGTCGAPFAVTGGQRFVCDLGDVEAATTSQSGRATVTYRVSSNEGQDINNVASVRSDTPDPDDTNNQATVSLTVSSVADLSLTKADAPDPVVAGTAPLTWTLSVANAGPSTATNVVAEDAVPAGVAIISVTGSGGASCTTGVPGDPFQPARCAWGSLPSGASGDRTMTIQAKVLSGTKGTLENDARISSDTFDPSNANDLASSLTTVNLSADLALTFAADTPTTKPSSTIHYKLTVDNLGPSDADGVVVTVNLPPLKSGYYVKDNGGCTLSNVTLTCPIGTFVAGAPTVTILIDWFVQGAKFPVVASASVTSATPDPVLANNSATSSVGKK